MKHCTSCGTELEPEYRFCTNCGTPVSEANQTGTQNITSKDTLSNSSVAELRIDILIATILGLVTFGIWWTLKLKSWSELHLKYYEEHFADSGEAKSSEILSAVNQSTNRTLQLAMITLVLLSIALTVLIVSFFYEVVFDIGAFPMPEELFWFYCWISLSMLAITWASVLFGILNILKLQSSNWLPLDGSTGIIITTVIWCILALGLLPLVIFPPIASGSVNKYVATLAE